jgi:nucleotide-binding universal stress UspA family protein/MFS family permease
MARTDTLPTSPQSSPPDQPRSPWRPGPLAGRYPAAAAMVILFLVPYLVLSSALPAIEPTIGAQFHMSRQELSITAGVANGAYALGTVLAVQAAQHAPQRRLLLAYGTLLVIGSVLAASATSAGVFIAGHVLQGLCTSLALIAAAPPLFLGFPAAKLRWTAVILNLCIFGAVAAGPLIGGAQASFHGWRPLFWIMTGIAIVGLALSLLTFQDAPPADRSAPRDPIALVLAAVGALAAFWGASELTTHRFLDPIAVIPLLGGLALIIALAVYQYRAKNPLLPLRLLNSTIPVTGIVVAICAAAASTSAIALTETVLAPHYTPLHLGLLYIPELGGAVITAIVFGAVFNTKLLPYFALTGMVMMAAGVLVLRGAIPPTQVLTLVGSGLVGIGIGASVTPALFLVGFSLRSAIIQRVFSILELARAVAAFMIAPVLLHFATTLTGLPTAAMTTTLWICFALSAGGAAVGAVLYTLGGVRPQAPSITRWMGGLDPAWYSPPLLATIRYPARRALAQTLARAQTAPASAGRIAASLASLPHRPGAEGHGGQLGPVVIAYDGSQMAKNAIAEAGRQLGGHRDALVVTVWRTFSVDFVPEPGMQFDAACGGDVGHAAGQIAASGAALADAAGFRAQATAVEGSPTWKQIEKAADDSQASLIVLGSKGRAGLGGRVAGSVAGDLASHSRRPVMIVHDSAAAGVPALQASASPG